MPPKPTPPAAFVVLQLPRACGPSAYYLAVSVPRDQPASKLMPADYRFVTLLRGPAASPDELGSPFWRVVAHGPRVSEALSRVGAEADWDAFTASRLAQYERDEQRKALLAAAGRGA